MKKLQEHAHSQQQPKKENIASSCAQHLVEGFAVECLDLTESTEMEDEVDEHQRIADAGKGKEEEGNEGEDGGKNAEPQIDVQTNLFTFTLPFTLAEFTLLCLNDAHNYGTFAALEVLMAVSIVIDHQEVVGGKSHSKTCDDEGNVPPATGHHIVGEDNGDKAEEDEYKEVAPTKVGELGGVEETEHDTRDAHH